MKEYLKYKFLPWEIDQAERYALESNKKFKNYRQLTKRTDDKKFLDAFVGYAGEFAFNEMLNPEFRGLLKEWASSEDKKGSPYDFLFDNGSGKDVTIDVKTTGSYNDRVPTADDCNFWLDYDWLNKKRSENTQLCDVFVQYFYDVDSDEAYFIGAVTLARLLEIEKSRKPWNGGTKVLKKEMDLTEQFEKYLKA